MVTHSLVEVVPSLLQHTNPQKNLIHKFTPELSGLNWQLFKEDKMDQKKQQTKRITQFLLPDRHLAGRVAINLQIVDGN
jgi:hypothetical protein